MKRTIFHAILALAIPLNVQAQTLSLSTASLDFGVKQTNLKDSLSFRIRNTSTCTVNVTDINTFKAAFTLRDTTFTIHASDSVTAWVYFRTNQNVTWTDYLVVENNAGHGPLILRLTGTGTYNEALYAPTQNLWENALKTALLALVNNQSVLGYNTSRDRMFESIDDYGSIDTVECVYSGRRIHAATRTEAQNQNFNTEHTWPQSFFSSADPMVCDLNHLYPTDAEPNNRRANYPFGPVANITWQDGTSKLGTRSTGEIVFEPRNTHKGDVARALFYFLIRYPVNYGGFMTARQESDLRVWDKFDTVSTKERTRNNGVALYQGKRNPLIDHPEFTDRITQYYTATAPTLYPDITVSPAAVAFDHVADSSDYNLFIVNRGRATLTVSSVSFQTPGSSFSVVSFPSSILVDSSGVVRVRFKPPAFGDSFTNNLLINSNDPDQPATTIPVSGYAGLSLSVQALLEGPYQPETQNMSTALNTAGILSARYPGASIPANAVDSVNIELRDSPSGSTATKRFYMPAWVLADGSVVNYTNGGSMRISAPAGSYYLVVRHANHLPVMSSTALLLSTLPGVYDFRFGQAQAYGTEPMKQVAPNMYALYAGDSNQSGVVSTSDANAVFGQLLATGYSLLDVNLSGVVTTADANMVFDNLVRASQVP